MMNKVHLCFFLTAMVSLNHGTPIFLSLSDPCGGSSVAIASSWSGRQVAARNSSLEDVANSALESAAESKSLRQKYHNNGSYARIANSLVSFLDTTHLPNLPYSRSITSNVSQTLQDDYNDVARIAVYMENVLQHENSSSVNAYSEEMSSFISTLRTTLCKIKLAADSHDTSLNVSIGNNTIPEDCRQISSLAERYCRDYLVFRDSEDYLNDMATDYSSFI